MKPLILSSLIIFNFWTAKSNDFTADSLHFILFNDTSQMICENSDTVFLDLDKDGSFDIRIWKNAYIENCFFSFEHSNNSKMIYLSPQPGCDIYLNYISGNIIPLAAKLQYGDSIDTNQFDHLGLYVYYNSMLGYHCQVVEVGWNKNDIGFMAVRKVIENDTAYYLVKIRVSNDADCFQVIDPKDDRLITNVSDQTKTTNIYFKNNILYIRSDIASEKKARIYNTKGNLISEKEIYTMVEEVDLSNFPKGVYVISIFNKENGNLETYKLVK